MKNFNSLYKPKSKFIIAQTKRLLIMRQSERWRQLSKTIRNRWVICQNPDCCEQPSTSVHHIRDAVSNPEIFWLETNLIPLCETHHRKADNQGVILDDELAEYWKIKINAFRTTGKKHDTRTTKK